MENCFNLAVVNNGYCKQDPQCKQIGDQSVVLQAGPCFCHFVRVLATKQV